MNTTYLSPGNAKTGDTCSFDLPARSTCPGKSAFCARACYAAKLSEVRPSVGHKYERNLIFAESGNFVSHLIREIPRRATVRIHVSGDFYSVGYVRRWIEIVSTRQDVEFYAYTRSWSIPELWEVIQELAEYPNITINLSTDKETGSPIYMGPNALSFRWTYLTDDDTVPDWFRRQDIIFRANHNARKGNHQWKRSKASLLGLDPDKEAPLQHILGGGTVCPLERGKKIDLSCAKCRLCIESPQFTSSDKKEVILS